MSESFLSILGYTRQEVKENFNDRFLDLIYPADREEVIKSLKRQLSMGNTVEMEYRVICKNGKVRWVLDRGKLVKSYDGTQTFYCMMIDITQRRQEQEALRLSLERHQVIMNQATDIIFEWDIRKDTLDFSSNWQKKFGYQPIKSRISRKIPSSANIHDADVQAFVKIMQDTAAGVPYSEAEFRIKNISGIYRWCRIRATTQYDEEGKPLKAVGVIADIDQEKMCIRDREYWLMKSNTFKNLPWLFGIHFFISAFTFGGGYVVIPMIRRYFVEKKQLFSEEELLEMAAIAQSSPGAIAVNLSVLSGYRTLGRLGAAVSCIDRKSTRLNSSHLKLSRMPSSA